MQWLAQGFHGEMHYMEAHGLKRARPAELVPGTVSVITARMDYLPRGTPIDVPPGWQAVEFERLRRPDEAIVSVYARGRDYHKVLRARLQKLCDRIAQAVGPLLPAHPGWRAALVGLVVAGQLVASLVLDHFGWLGFPQHTLSVPRAIGALLILAGVLLVRRY